MSDIGRFLSRCGESVTLKTINYGLRNDVTKWPAITYTDSSILAYFEPGPSRSIDFSAGTAGEVRIKMWTASTIHQRDRVVRGSVTYEIEEDPMQHDSIRGLSYFTAVIIKVS